VQIEAREVAASGIAAGDAMAETSVALNVVHAMTVFRTSGLRIGYAVGNASGAPNWTEGVLPDAEFEIQAGLVDPMVVTGPVWSEFIATAMHAGHESVVKSRFDVVTGQWTPWEVIGTARNDLGGALYDKPVLVAGDLLPTGQEYYMVVNLARTTFPVTRTFSYRRSSDGGNTWVGGAAQFADGTLVPGREAFWAAAGADGHVYVLYRAGTKIRGLVGKDQPDGTVTFSTVNGAGLIHIFWYDDRDYNTASTGDQLDGFVDPKYDVFHASATPILLNFQEPARQNEFLAPEPNPQEPAVDFGLPTGLPFLGDYNQITARGTRLMATYAGHRANTPGDDSVIWSTGTDRDGDGDMDACDCTGDLDGDRSVGPSDLMELLLSFGSTGGDGDTPGDVNADGRTDLADLAILLSNYGMECP